MLDGLPDTFNEAQLKALRVSLGKSEEGAVTTLRSCGTFPQKSPRKVAEITATSEGNHRNF